MARQFQPRRLDVQAFAEDGAEITGETPLTGLARLAAEGAPGGAGVRWSARGELRNPGHVNPQPWLHLEAEAALGMVCQRCLEPVQVPLAVDRSFRFVADEATAEAEDDEAQEDLLALDRAFDLLGLVEDELLMEVPAVPRHDTCPVPVKLTAGDADFGEVAPPNPFAALEALKKGRGH